jgi:two-component sensor histidine kinase
MIIEHLPYSADSPPNTDFEYPERRSKTSYEKELNEYRRTETRLRFDLAKDAALLRQKDAAIQRLELLSKEAGHRFLNDLQIVVSLLSLQSRAAANPETASQLAAAADRITTIGRIHRRLHYADGVQTVAFKQFLDDLCDEFSTMLYADEPAERRIVVEAIEINLPTTLAIPLGYIVNELMTNAAKYGDGVIAVRLERIAEYRYALSVCNGGPGLPEGYDPMAHKGLGMRIIRSFVDLIRAELKIGTDDKGQGARFEVIFSTYG